MSENKFMKHLRNCEYCESGKLCSLGEKLFDNNALEAPPREIRCNDPAAWHFSNKHLETKVCKKHAKNSEIAKELRGLKKEKAKSGICEVTKKKDSVIDVSENKDDQEFYQFVFFGNDQKDKMRIMTEFVMVESIKRGKSLLDAFRFFEFGKSGIPQEAQDGMFKAFRYMWTKMKEKGVN